MSNAEKGEIKSISDLFHMQLPDSVTYTCVSKDFCLLISVQQVNLQAHTAFQKQTFQTDILEVQRLCYVRNFKGQLELLQVNRWMK